MVCNKVVKSLLGSLNRKIYGHRLIKQEKGRSFRDSGYFFKIWFEC